MAKSIFDKSFIDRLTIRSTDQIFNQWKVNYRQDDYLLDNDSVETYLINISNTLPTSLSTTSPFVYAYLHNQVMREYIFSTYKALAILKSIIRDIKNGQQTYSEISSYLVNMLLAKSISLILGVWYSHSPIRQSSNNKDEFFIIDLFHKRGNTYESRIFNIQNTRLNHSQFWKMFVVILKNTTGMHISNNLSIFINNIDYNDFSLIRNFIQYSYSNWIFDDLKEDNILDYDWFTSYSHDLNLDFKNFSNNSNKLLSLELLKLNNLLFKEIAVYPELSEHLINFKEVAQQYDNWIN